MMNYAFEWIRDNRMVVGAAAIVIVALTIVSCSEETTTGFQNREPGTPTVLWPADGSVNQTTDLILAWQCLDPDGDSLRYDLYVGSTSEPSIVDSNRVNTIYIPAIMKFNTTYYWKVIAFDEYGDSAASPIWSFSTRREPGIYEVASCTLEIGNTNWCVLQAHDNYALVAGNYSPLIFVNITDPEDPFAEFEYSAPGYVYDIEFDGNLAYLAEIDYGLEIVDITNPASPVRIGSFPMGEGVFSVELSGNYAFVAGNGAYTLDISNPSSPIPVDSTFQYQMMHLTIAGSYVYAVHADFEVSVLDSYDIVNGTTLQYNFSRHLNALATDITTNNQHLFISLWDGTVRALTISDFPSEISRFASLHGFYDIFLDSDIIYAANGSGGVKMISFADLLNPALIAGYDTGSSVLSIHANRGFIFAIDSDSRFLVLEYLP